MTAEQLMKPRFKVIALYPMSIYKLGEVIEYNNDILTEEAWGRIMYEPYPAIFKKLQWWEERSLDDLPEYLSTGKGVVGETFEVYKIIEWENDNGNIIGWIDKEQRIVCSLGVFKPEYEYQPSTKEEYEQFKQSNP